MERHMWEGHQGPRQKQLQGTRRREGQSVFSSIIITISSFSKSCAAWTC